VLIQGHASFPRQADRAWLESIEDNWVRFAGPRRFGRLWDRWLDVYHWERVGIEVAVDRVVVWPDLGCTGEPAVYGTPLQDVPPAPQRPPRGGTGPRIAHRRAARAATRLPDVLLGWVDADGFPAVAPVSIGGAGPDGIELTAPPGIPPGGRRAGLTAHAFTRYVRGQIQRVHTGWLEAGDRLVYAPHTQAAYRLPESLLLYRLVVGGFTRLRQRQARRAGFLPER
jgi:hypothetical protein